MILSCDLRFYVSCKFKNFFFIESTNATLPMTDGLDTRSSQRTDDGVVGSG